MELLPWIARAEQPDCTWTSLPCGGGRTLQILNRPGISGDVFFRVQPPWLESPDYTRAARVLASVAGVLR